MSSTPRRRDSRLPRRLPPRPTFASEATPAAAVPGDDLRGRRDSERAALAAERESRFLVSELKRVASVTATCIGMLIVLAILQRMQG